MSRYLSDVGVDTVIGKKIDRALWTGRDIVLCLSDGTVSTLTPDGSCCSECTIADVDGSDALKGGTLLRVEDLELVKGGNLDDYEAVDVWGHRFVTDKGICTIGMRLEHNGYYSGQLYVQQTLEAPDAPELEDFS